MDRVEVHGRLQSIFRDVFNNVTLEIYDATTAKDIEGWDSFQQINLIVAIEDEFALEVPLKRVNMMENVGEMIDYITGELS